MSTSKILVVEDDSDIRELITLHLKKEGHSLESSDNGNDAIRKIRTQEFHLLILDWMLPEVSGLELIKEARKLQGHDQLGILMVTAKSSNSDLIIGLENGADDYITKPFEISVLLARVRAILRRKERKNTLELGPLIMDEHAHEAHLNGEPLPLTPYEFKLLTTLLQNRGRVLTRDQLIQEVQGMGVAVVERAIDTHIFGLRKKLGECAELIETVRGVGYRVAHKI